jgi:hypothetical protein
MDALANNAKVTLTKFIANCVSLVDVVNEFKGFINLCIIIISQVQNFLGTFPLGKALWFLLGVCNLIASKSLVFLYFKLSLIS